MWNFKWGFENFSEKDEKLWTFAIVVLEIFRISQNDEKDAYVPDLGEVITLKYS
jgi:hypothetical protein